MSYARHAPETAKRQEAATLVQVQRTFWVNCRYGLHARPCALLVKTLHPCHSKVMVEANGEQVSGDSILGLMTLAAGPGSAVKITVVGEDALQTMAAIQRLFDTRFQEDWCSPVADSGIQVPLPVVQPQASGFQYFGG